MTSCKDVTALVSRSLDERLSWPQRLQVRVHLVMCSACRRFEQQTQFLSHACKALGERIDGRLIRYRNPGTDFYRGRNVAPLFALFGPCGLLSRLLDRLQSPFMLATRLWVSWQFLKSGILKVQDWESTLFLFQEEYRVPLLSPQLAALAGTAGELVFPVLLGLGLFGRFAALGLSAVNVLAVVAYAHILLKSGFEAALGQHVLWGFMLLVAAVYGPGTLSIDRLMAAPAPRSP